MGYLRGSQVVAPWHEIADFMQRAAVGETLAHIVLLENHGRVRREGGAPTRYYLPDQR